MKEIQKNLDSLFIKAGNFNKYQFIIVVLFFLQFICSQFFHTNFSYLTSRPLIIINDTETRIDPNLCDIYFNDINSNNSNNSIILRENQIPTTSIILDFQLYCDNIKTYLISIFYYLGIIIGSCISYIFYDKIGTKLTISIFIPILITSLILFQLLNFAFMKNNIYVLYCNLFILGMSEYITIIIILLYICDIITLNHIPMFITIIISGRSISYLLGVIFFNLLYLNWKTDLIIIASVNIIIFIFISIYMIKSPKAALRNNDYINFIKYLLKISIKNKRKLNKEDFDLFLPFLNEEEKNEYKNIFSDENNGNGINVINLVNSTNNIEDNEEINEGINEGINGEMYKEKEVNKNINNNLLNDPLLLKTEEFDIDKEENNLKEDYLLSEENNKIGSIQTLFNKTKMNDYSPLDLLKIKEHLINFSVLSFLWSVYNFIKYGLDFTAREIIEYNDNIIWVLGTHLISLINLFIIMIIYMSNHRAFHKLLISIQLITFIALLVTLHLDNISINKNIYILSIIITQIVWNCLYLLLMLITILTYPIMLRSKGLGLNIAFGTIGKLVVMFLVDSTNEHEYILYFILFDFFLLVFSNSLPHKIGSFVLGIDYIKNKKEKNEILINKLNDNKNIYSSDDGEIFDLNIDNIDN